MTESRVVPLRRIFRVVNGGTPTSDPENWNGNVPWVTPVDLGAAAGVVSETQRTLTLAGAVSGSRIVPRGSLILSTRAPIGYVAVNDVDAAFNQGCRALVPYGGDVDIRYFYFHLVAAADELRSRGQGSTFQELSSDALATMPVHLPEPEEQRRIAGFLDVETRLIDNLRASRQRMIELLALKRDRLIDELVSGGQDASAFVPLKYLVSSVSVGIVITPAAWYVETGGVPALRGLNVKPGRIDASDLVQISHEGHLLHRKSRLTAGDLVVVRTGQAGAAAAVPPELDGVNCIDLVIVRPGPAVLSKFAEYLLNSSYAKRRVSEFSVGSIQAHFNVAAMKAMPVPSYSIADQEKRVSAIEEAVQPIEQAMSQMREQDRLLGERRQALITAAVTGQIDVTTARGVS